MIKPTYYLPSIYDLKIDKLSAMKINYLLIDFDNTLIPFNQKIIDDRALNLLNNLMANNITPIIISNNSQKRIKIALNNNNIMFLSNACKPFKFKVKRYLKEKKINFNECILIGDQIFSDIQVANKLKIKSILVNPLSNNDLIITKLKRHLDLKARKKLKDIERF